MIKFEKDILLSKKSEIIKICKQSQFCERKFIEQLINAYTNNNDENFYSILLINLGYIVRERIVQCPISIDIPDTVKVIDNHSAFSGCFNLQNINVDSNNSNYSSLDGVLYNKDKTILIRCPEGKIKINISNSVKEIGKGAFSNCRNLKLINIPASVESIEYSVFFSCFNLTKIDIPNSVSYIGDHAFSDCNNLKFVNIPNSVKSIGDYAFSFCPNLKSVTIPKDCIFYPYTFPNCEFQINYLD